MEIYILDLGLFENWILDFKLFETRIADFRNPPYIPL